MVESDEEKIRRINQELKEYYGEPEQPTEMSGIDYLVETILSQNTNDINRDKAFQNLKEKYGDNWKTVENADYEELTDTIRIAGLGPTKAERIQKALEIIREDQGEYSIDFIEDMSIEEGKKWLTEIPGIGPKTAAIILCFHFDKPVMPVDTHVHRVSKRLGIIPETASRTKAHDILEEKVPDDIKYEFHRLLIDHGREHCKAQNPTCEEGPLGEECAPIGEK
ncbi:endonuclease III domain-containing protein [Candidatus Nanohalobium constans]|uniref:Endonuclease III n=1 Tax=Candidatus Nanohalobium constans TaxID=2565781 RepID=A0A5Q0UII7_9ARCH|nr:endonuclease III [Candidatus Nanohalobium constans]QGA80755.1 endonuclease III [Candidatus Nanohalobium constans]